MARLSVKLCIIAMIPVVGIAYTNCSKVGFEDADMASKIDGLGAQDLDSGAILINEGAEFTNSLDVSLRLDHNSADKMLISNNEDCSTDGVWENFSRRKSWKMNKENQQAKVFVRFRSSADPEMENVCYHDAIVHDSVAPQIRFSRNSGSFFNKSNFDFEFSVADELSGVSVVGCQADASWSSGCNQGIKNHSLSEGFHHIRVEATDKAGNKAPAVEDSFTIDLTPPSISFSSVPPLVTGDVSAKFVFAAVDPISGVDKYECRSSQSSSFVACVSPVSLSFPEGQNSFHVRAYDKAGNVSNVASYTWKVDLTAPSVNITKAPEAITNSVSAVFEFVGQDEGKALNVFKCSVDKGAFVSCNSPLNLSSLSEGDHNFSVVGYDEVGNASAPASFSWKIDLSKPKVELVTYPDKRTKSQIASFGFRVSDGDSGSGVKASFCSLDGASYAACSSPAVFEGLADGDHYFYVKAIDNAGNFSDAVSYAWHIDNIKPVVTITSTPEKESAVTLASFAFSAADANDGSIASTECRLNSTYWEACSSPKKYEDLIKADHLFEVRATDSVGNVSDIKSYSWKVAIPDPVVICDPFGSTSVTKAGITARLTYYDGSNASNAIKNISDLFSKGQKVEDTVVLFSQIKVPTRSFTDGFDIGNGKKLQNSRGEALVEWFGLDYTTNLKLADDEAAGIYQLATVSDDGSIVWLDQGAGMAEMVNNDGHTSTRVRCGATFQIKKGDRIPMRMKYFQGPRTEIAVNLLWRKVESSTVLKNSKYCDTNGTFNDSTSNYKAMLADGWKVMKADNFETEEMIPNKCD